MLVKKASGHANSGGMEKRNGVFDCMTGSLHDRAGT